MAQYPSMLITQNGTNLYAKVQSGTTLTFTRMEIGSGRLATSAVLNQALTSGTAYTSLTVNALSGGIASGSTLTIGADTITTSAYAAPGATSISVNSYTPSANVSSGASITVTTQNQSALTALVTSVDWVDINSMSESGSTANILAVYENTTLNASTYVCELGLFAQDPDLGEILYAYANAGANGDTFPPYADGPYSRTYEVSISVGNASSVTVNVPGTAYVSTTEVGSANGVASLDGNGYVPSSQLGNVPPSNIYTMPQYWGG